MKETNEIILRLHRNGDYSDRLAIQHLLNGGRCLDVRTGEIIEALTLKELPPGCYWVAPE